MPADHTAPARFTVRHYCQGIGDCHLLCFPKANGDPFWLLIDCGIHTSISGGSQLMDDIVADIRQVTGDHIDVLVLTHEHADHNSAFLPSSGRFEGVKVGEVWMAWTESGEDKQARELDKFKQQALSALAQTSQRLSAARGLNEHLQSVRSGVDNLLDFSFGAKGDKVRSMREGAEALVPPEHIRYLEPSDPPITLRGLPNLRAYVLAPSRDTKYLSITERGSEMYRMANGEDRQIAHTLNCAFAAGASGGMVQDYSAPFDPSAGTPLAELGTQTPAGAGNGAIPAFAWNHYYGPAVRAGVAVGGRKKKAPPDPNERDQSWRRIDHDWLGASADLAMQLDSKTNNTSLVLAFELVDTGRVFLFAADAQVGNWLSWQDTSWTLKKGQDPVTGPDLLARTVYYKVGHHGSQNATLEAKGLELMTHEDLSAFIPTHEKDAKKVKWGAMPFRGILDALQAHCGKRVIRADDEWLLRNKPPFKAPSGSIQAIKVGSVGTDDGNTRQCWVELTLE